MVRIPFGRFMLVNVLGRISLMVAAVLALIAYKFPKYLRRRAERLGTEPAVAGE